MSRNIAWTVAFAAAAALLESTILRRLAVFHAVPDLALGIVVYTAYINGAMTGQLSGFFSGLLIDFLSAAPLGLNAFVRTLAGALAGLLKGNFFLDAFMFPMALCAGATAVKAAALFLLSRFFPGVVPAYDALGPTFWAEFALNTLLAPALFGFLKLFDSLLIRRRGD